MKSSTKKIIYIIIFIAFIIFARKLYVNYCFHQIFEKDITDEQIISFTCDNEFWTSGHYYEIAFFCDEQCFSSLFDFEHQKLQQSSKIGKIDSKSISSTLYHGFKRRLEKHYGEKVNEVVIYYSLYHEDHYGHYGDELWYEPDSQLCMFVNYEL